MNLKSLRALVLLSTVAGLLAGCASSQMKARREQRDKVSQTSKLYCEFVNGEVFPDVDVQLNIEMAKRCDVDKAFTVTSYKTSNENNGLVYCCGIRPDAKSESKAETRKEAKAETKSESKGEGKKVIKASDDELSE